METRKVEEYPDGTRLRSDKVQPEARTSLSWEPLPSLADIEAQPEFTVQSLSAEPFADAWASATDSE
jgi:hypothetical protein